MAENKLEWFKEMSDKFSSGVSHVFVLHGNVKDYVEVDDNYFPVNQALNHLFKQRDAVVFYNRSAGWRCRNSKETKLIETILEAGAPKPAGANPLQAVAADVAAKAAAVPQKKPELALPQFEILLRSESKVAVVIEYAESVFATSGWNAAGANGDLMTQVVTLMRWATDSQIHDRNNPIILLCSESLQDLHPALRSPQCKIEPIFIPYPDRPARKDFINWYLKHKDVDMNGLTVDALANLTNSLSLIMIEDILLRSQQMGALKDTYVKDRKTEIVKAEFGDMLEIPEPSFGWDTLGALDHIQKYVKKSIVDPIKSGDYSRVPMGVLFVGPPGTGKSRIAQAIAKDAGINFAKYNPGRAFGKFQGDSEKNTERAFQAIRSMAPVAVFIDETDKAVPSEDAYQGDSGSAMRLLQRLQDFMSDGRNRGKIIWLGATNRPDKMSAAMKRAGRFDKKVPVLAPGNDAERADVFKGLFVQYDIQFKGSLAAVAKATENYVPADIEQIVLKAWEMTRDDKKTLMTEKYLTEACELMLPSVSADDIKFMTALAIQECNDLSLLPPGHTRKTASESLQVVEEFHKRESRGEL